ncbi:hypothetical protein CBR_g24318 [Chara braunii]|uniref:Solute carrier family 40 member n=1 Tax=Chara braunii TaxID=69332 RepID=A0A388JMC7_CHABU|nr:hypothetical protein CBR_g24318 [Chara braunii]|eukprot:GBG58969.1 hypothetical protein CBR_g24318 [Chara braunii]
MINAKLSVCCSSSAAAVPPTALRHHERRLQAEDVFGRNADAQLDSACVSAEGSATRLRGGCSPLRCAGASGLLTRRAPQAYFLRRQAHGHTEDSSVNLNCGCLLQDAWRPREHVVSAWAPFLSPNDSQGGAIGPRLSRPCKRWSQCTCHLGGTGLSVAPPTLDDSESDGCGFELLEANILRCSGGDAAGSDFDELDATSSAQRNNNHRVTDWDKLPGDDESPPRYDKSGAGRLRCDDDSTLASLLPSVIQVQTKEEQEQLSGTAAHPRALQGCTYDRQSVSMDFMDTLVTSKSGKRHISVMIDRFTKYTRLVAMPETTRTDHVIKLFQDNWTLGQIGTALLLIHAFQSGPSMAASSAALIRQPWYMLFIALAAVDRLGGLATSVAFERDWVVQVPPGQLLWQMRTRFLEGQSLSLSSVSILVSII